MRGAGGDGRRGGGRSEAPSSASRGDQVASGQLFDHVQRIEERLQLGDQAAAQGKEIPARELHHPPVAAFGERQLEDSGDAQPVGRDEGDLMAPLAVARDMQFDQRGHRLLALPRRQMRKQLDRKIDHRLDVIVAARQCPLHVARVKRREKGNDLRLRFAAAHGSSSVPWRLSWRQYRSDFRQASSEYRE